MTSRMAASGTFSLLGLDAGVAEDTAEPLRVFGDALAEFVRRGEEHLGRLRLDDAQDVRTARGLAEFVVKPLHDQRWRTRRRHHPVPHFEVETGEARFRHGRNPGLRADALRSADGDDA